MVFDEQVRTKRRRELLIAHLIRYKIYRSIKETLHVPVEYPQFIDCFCFNPKEDEEIQRKQCNVWRYI